jgi:hypothetical protein
MGIEHQVPGGCGDADEAEPGNDFEGLRGPTAERLRCRLAAMTCQLDEARISASPTEPRAMANRMCEARFGRPEGVMVAPRSLKKLRKKRYRLAFGS